MKDCCLLWGVALCVTLLFRECESFVTCLGGSYPCYGTTTYGSCTAPYSNVGCGPSGVASCCGCGLGKQDTGGSCVPCPAGSFCPGKTVDGNGNLITGSGVAYACTPATACPITGLAAQPYCLYDVQTLAGLSNTPGTSDGVGTNARFGAVPLTTGGSCLAGAASQVSFGYDQASDSIFVTDRCNHRIRKVVGNTVTTLSGSSKGYVDGTSPKFNEPLQSEVTRR